MSNTSTAAPVKFAGRRLTRVLRVFAIAALIGNVAIVSAGGNPPGNSGTIKIDALPFDTRPDNEPHVTCPFQVDFYGFDANATARLTFEADPPTGRGILLIDNVQLDGDDASGGGSEAGLNSEFTYDLSGPLAAYQPHPKQGYHVTLTVNVTGSQGADTKHKVFWAEDCEVPPYG